MGNLTADSSSAEAPGGLPNRPHRAGHAEPNTLEPGKVYQVRMALRLNGRVFFERRWLETIPRRLW